MTKYNMTKRFMSETGLSKKEASKMLRDAGWNYQKAKDMHLISTIDWDTLIKAVNDAIIQVSDVIAEVAESISKSFARISQDATVDSTEEK